MGGNKALNSHEVTNEDSYVRAFVRARNKAFTEAVLHDDWEGVKDYMKRWNPEADIPENENVMKAGIYKAVQYCTDISEEVKSIAFQKCIEIGFYPGIRQ